VRAREIRLPRCSLADQQFSSGCCSGDLKASPSAQLSIGLHIPTHYCIDPLDPYAEREVLVTYEAYEHGVLIISAIDHDGIDIFPELTSKCVRILRVEIAVYRCHLGSYAYSQSAVDLIEARAAT
jgi:hypothetical protein